MNITREFTGLKLTTTIAAVPFSAELQGRIVDVTMGDRSFLYTKSQLSEIIDFLEEVWDELPE